MSLREDIIPYISSSGLINPGLNTGSNNGVMYCNEYYLLLKLNNELTETDKIVYRTLMTSCMKEPGLLMRNPDGSGGQESVDDYIGLLAGAAALEQPQLAKSVIEYGKTNRGIFNNIVPGKFTGSSFLVRQPQLIAAAYYAAGLKPFFLLTIYMASVILLSGWKVPKENTDARRLCWFLIKIVESKSWLCRLASKVWYKRLYKTYPEGMKSVRELYYEAGHPFIKYSVD